VTAALYVSLVAVLVAAVPLTVWLKREGDRSWAAFQRRRSFAAQFAAMSASWMAVSVSIAANFQPFIAAMNDAAAVTARLAETLATIPTAPTDEETPDR
jgi:hypothetical protein